MTNAEVKALIERCVKAQGNQLGLEGIADLLGQFANLIGAIAPEYAKTSTYAKNALVIYGGKLYAAKVANVTGDWDSTKWEERTLAAAIALKADAA